MSPPTPPQKSFAFWAALVALAILWFRLIDHLRIEWSINEQYAYGWAVPLLCVLLIWRDQQASPSTASAPITNRLAFAGLLLGLLLFLPTRFIAEANPDWRMVSWALAVEVILVSWFWLPRLGVSRASCLFPLAFFLIAVPWPTRMEQAIIQTLTRWNSAATIEILNLSGVPALARGNVIEISTGLVGIDEACSGIRSFQATLMLALFFGAWYRLRPRARIGTIVIGFLLALLFNLGRTLLLVVVAAKQGVPAIDRWHDPVGVTLLLGCFGGVWLTARFLRHTGSAATSSWLEKQSVANSVTPSAVGAWLTLGFLILAEVSCAAWFQIKERQLPSAITWEPSFSELDPPPESLPIADRTRSILRYSSAKNVRWSDENGIQWQMIYLQWNAGRIASHLARNHTPEVCLSSAGHTLESVSEIKVIFIAPQLALPFRCYTFDAGADKLFVFYCLREDRPHTTHFETESLTMSARMSAVLEGRRNLGQRSLEIALWNAPSEEAAEQLVRAELKRLISHQQTAGPRK